MTIPVFPLLRLLSDGRFHDSREIGIELGVSPNDVSEAVASLASAGLNLEQVAQAGYRLITPFSALNAAKIERFLGDRANRFTVDVVDETGSTNDDLLLSARQGATSGLVRVAETQTAGRGRRQRKWISAPGGTLTFSLLWIFEDRAYALAGLSLAVGVSVVRSLHALSLSGIQLKWPNDLLWQHRKLGGILIETAAGTGNSVSAIIGIGLNLRLLTQTPKLIDQPATDLESAGLRVDRNELLGRLLYDLHDVLGTFSRDGFVALRPEWERSHAYQDKMVTLDGGGDTQWTGKVMGVNENGALILETESGARAFHGGELSLRPSAN